MQQDTPKSIQDQAPTTQEEDKEVEEEETEEEEYFDEQKLEEELEQWLAGQKLERFKPLLLKDCMRIELVQKFSVDQLAYCLPYFPRLHIINMKHHFSSESINNKNSLESTVPTPKGKVGLAVKMYEEMPSPSTFADSSHKRSWYSTKSASLMKHFFVHRPSSQNSTPVTILSEILSDLYSDIYNESLLPSREDCDAALEIMAEVSDGFESKVAMASWIRRWARNKMDWDLSCDTDLDGTWMNGNNMIMNLAVRLEKRGEGDSYMENCACYAKNWIDTGNTCQIEKSVCPAILLEVVGTQISVSGAIFTSEGVICDPFIIESLLYNTRNYNQCLRVARIFHSISKAAVRLSNFHDTLPDEVADEFPYFRSFHKDQLRFQNLFPSSVETIELKYTSKISNMIFVAEMLGKTVIVKFTQHKYNSEAQNILHNSGYAPAVFFCEKVGAYYVVIMERISNVHWSTLTKSEKGEVVEKVRKGIAELHDHKIVHGDLRRNNILVSRGATDLQVSIIDFDWAGTHGVDRYPCFMNHTDITWPQGASDGQILDFSHDLCWIQRQFV